MNFKTNFLAWQVIGRTFGVTNTIWLNKKEAEEYLEMMKQANSHEQWRLIEVRVREIGK